MSASHAKSSKRNIPSLPPEVWLDIFQKATYVSGIVGPDMEGYSLETICSRYHQRLLKDSLLTKRYVVRVCKQWWFLATPFLYETLLIGRSRSLSSLCRTLSNSKDGMATLNADQPLGWRTKRIYVTMRDRCYRHGDIDLDLLAEIIGYLPNLVIVSFGVTSSQYIGTRMPKSIMNALADRGSSLKALEWSTWCLNPTSADLMELLACTPHLRILHCRQAKGGNNDVELPFMPSLTALSFCPLSCKWFVAAEDRLPCIQQVAYRGYVWPARLAWLRFLDMSGGNITTIYLHPVFLINGLQSEMDKFRRYCPRLTNLTLSVGRWDQLVPDPDPELILPPIRYLGIKCGKKQAHSREYRLFFDFLSHISVNAPSLRVVQLIDHYNVDDLRNHHAHVLRQGLRQLSGVSFQLQDHEGNIMRPFDVGGINMR